MRVTILCPMFPRVPSGGPKVIYEYANRLVSRGHAVEVLHHRAIAPRREPITRLRGRLSQMRQNLRSGGLSTAVRWMSIDDRVVMATVDEFQPRSLPSADVTIATYWTTAQVLSDLRPDHGAPVHLIQSYETWAGPEDTVHDVLRLPVPKIAVSRHLVDVLADLGVPEDLITHVPNGLDLDVFRVRNDPAARGPVIALLAHPSPVKGLDTAVDVLTRVRSAFPTVAAVAFGTQARASELPDWVDYVRSPTPEVLVDDIYNRSSVFLCTSRHEGWGFPATEAMACGSVLVSTRNGGVDDFARDGESALLADVDDPAALADAVLRVLRDDALRARLRAGGLAEVAALDWSRSTDRLEHALLTAAGLGTSSC